MRNRVSFSATSYFTELCERQGRSTWFSDVDRVTLRRLSSVHGSWVLRVVRTGVVRLREELTGVHVPERGRTRGLVACSVRRDTQRPLTSR